MASNGTSRVDKSFDTLGVRGVEEACGDLAAAPVPFPEAEARGEVPGPGEVPDA